MNIRKAEKKDFGEIFRIVNGESELRHVHEGRNYNTEWVRNMILGEAYLSLVAEDEGRVVGLLTAEFWKSERYSFMLDLWIARSYRKRGIATLLEKEYERLCKKAKMRAILGSVIVSNKKMKSFIKKRGYKLGTKVYYFEKILK